MKLYLSHSSNYDYQSELYASLKSALVNEHEIVFPHDGEVVNSLDSMKHSDFVIAEVSYPSTGQGIELGWADANNVPTVCFHRSDAKPSGAIQLISSRVFDYVSVEDMVEKLREALS